MNLDPWHLIKSWWGGQDSRVPEARQPVSLTMVSSRLSERLSQKTRCQMRVPVLMSGLHVHMYAIYTCSVCTSVRAHTHTHIKFILTTIFM